METNKTMTRIAALIALFVLAGGAQAAATQLANSPLSGASSVEISPNIMFVLDDSGSMDWDYLPDWAGITAGRYQGKNASFNGIAYNPAVNYTPPKYFDVAGAVDTTTYPSQTSAATSAWTSVKDDGYGVQTTGRSNLVGIAYYYTTVAGEYCTNRSMKDCVAASAPTTSYPVAAKLRWCKTAADAVAAVPSSGACQATEIDPSPPPPATPANIPFNFPRMPAPRVSTIAISGSSSTSISNLTVDSQIILSAAIAATTSPATLASALETGINACTFELIGNCQVAGYSAVVSGPVGGTYTVTISAPGVPAAAPVITQSGSMAGTPSVFARPANNLAPGENLLTVITSSRTTYPKATGRNDCAGSSDCTYAEEMTNYANWWAYYHTRMQTMKTATSLSFEPIDSSFRVGYMTINNNTATDFQNIGSFSAAQKKAWYDKLFAAIPAQNTPLRIALANAGRLYAGRLNGTSFNGVTVVDPVQHYCQQNVTILSTDGYWNEGPGFQWNGITAVGDQDGPGLEVRPQLDGGGPQEQQTTTQTIRTDTQTAATQAQIMTEQLQSLDALVETRTFTQPQARLSFLQGRDSQLQSRTSQLEISTFSQQQVSTFNVIQEQTSQLQQRIGQRQQNTSQLQTRTQTVPQQRTSQLQSQTRQLQSKTYQLQQQLTQVQQRTSTNAGTTWSAWSDTPSCSQLTRGATGTNRTECRVLGQSAWTNVSSCSVVAGGSVLVNAGLDSEATVFTTDSQCQYTSPAWVNAASCTAVAKSPGPTSYSVGTAVDCQVSSSSAWTNVSSCTASATVGCQYAAWTGWTNVASCTPLNQSSGPSYTVGVARECQSVWSGWTDTSATCTTSSTVECRYQASGWSDVSSCSTVAESSGSPYTVTLASKCRWNYGSFVDVNSCTETTVGAIKTDCQYAGWSGWSNVASCSAVAQSSAPNFTVGLARQCRTQWSTFTNATTCVPSATTQCQTAWTPYTTVASCTASATTRCQYQPWTAWTNVASCTAVPQSTGPSYSVGVATECQTVTGSWNYVGSCDASATRECQYSAWSGWGSLSSCTPVAQSTGPNYTVATGRECRTDWTPWTATASCTPVAGATECRTSWPSPWANTASCTPSATQQCRTLPVIATWTNIASCTAGTVGGLTTSCQNVVPPPTTQAVAAANCTAGTVGSVVTTCNTLTTGPTNVASCTPQAATAANNYVETSCSVVGLGPTSDTLADVAEYYWKTDLRDPLQLPDRCTGGPVISGSITSYNDVCTNDTRYPRQFMNTYTLGLGASGLMQYQADYLSASSGDFNSVKLGVTADPSTGLCPWQKLGDCNWPKPESNTQTNIDDLWHAAVNGRGTYFSASDPSSLAAGISGALSSVSVRAGALSAVTVTSPNLVAGSNGVFEVSFRAGEWSGDVVKRTIDGTTGVLSTTSVWSAQAELDAKVSAGTHTARTIYTYNPGSGSVSGSTDQLKFFLWANLTTSEQDYFATAAINTLSQFCTVGTICLASATQTSASGENLVNFVRGDKSNEGPLADLAAYYRQRTHLLGDISGSEAVYVQGSPWNYADYQYGAFKSANASRAAMVYVAANDGMLHALDALTGEEEWAYLPALVMPKLYKLADKNYAAPGKHQFLVDATPVSGDICTSNCATPSSGSPAAVWKTILVGGLNNGGRGYYALDITDPAAPKSLWEFTDNNLGYTFGNPVITKLKDGTWVVIVSSGYNNISPGDGQGRLFILNADTGALIRSISTGAGDTTTPSGLSRITAWANFPDNNNTAQRVYGGDLLGNVWRFDVNGDIPVPAIPPALPVYDAQRLATLVDANAVAQPITSKPELGMVNGYPVVFVATGQLLGSDDLVTSQGQSLYAIKDRLTDTDYGSPRPLTPAQTTPVPGDFVTQTLTTGVCPTGNAYCTAGDTIVTATNNAVDFHVKDGWYIDFPVAGERVNTDLRLQLGTLAFNTNTPTAGACVPVGVSFAYFLDYRSGGYVDGTSGLLGVRLGEYLSSAPSVIRLEDGTIRELIRTDAPDTISAPVPTAPGPLDTRRVSWRELVTE
ncbi:MAG: hypothetical protein H6942_14475 [Candidatus Accumulibacter sp.]|uniref:PilC/PilY family type IV pilus protein n=1 Tax=Accumulibacter sp. TaxID=2053492 RepID=UPI0025FC03E5|nr:PilC/PilY family type IV pilus protein [Accumulibacter sp.]MCP5249718.1 hypothetical protein [Accumulibacter sp.]